MYRMSHADFHALYALVERYLPARDPFRSEYRNEELLLAVLRVLGEGCSFDAAARAVDLRSKSIVDHYYDGILQAIIQAVQATKGLGPEMDCSISFPSSPAELQAEKERWTAGKTPGDRRYDAFEGCIGAGDGTLVPVLLKSDDSFSVAAHRSRKGKTRGDCQN